MKRFLLITLFSAALALPVKPVVAQITQADSAAVLLGVAQRLRAEGRISLANSLVDLILERYAGTAAAAEAQRLRAELRRVPEERSGKTELLVWTTLYGLSLGVMVPASFNVDEPEVYGIGLIVGGPAGFLLGRGIGRMQTISEGQARAISLGTLWGAWQGLGWTYALDLGVDKCAGCFADDPSAETVVRGTLIGSLVGFGTGVALARKNISAGTATTVSFGALWGTWYSFALTVLTEMNDGDDAMMTTLIGGNIGLVSTALLAPSWNLSRGRARLISISGLAGLLAGFGALLIIQPDDFDKAIGVPMATSAIGLGLGVRWTRNYDERGSTRQPSPGGEALLDLRDGRWSLNLPEPNLRMLETRAGNRPVYRPGLALPLLKAAF